MIFAEPKGLGNSASLSGPLDPTKSDILYNYDILKEFLSLNGFIISPLLNMRTLIFKRGDINITIDMIRITYHSSIDIKTFSKVYDLIDYVKKCLCDIKLCIVDQ
jgi:hypothetical protein